MRKTYTVYAKAFSGVVRYEESGIDETGTTSPDAIIEENKAYAVASGRLEPIYVDVSIWTIEYGT